MAKALVIAAPHSGSGKTLVTLGLIRALRNKGCKVASAKIGPDYIDPGFHSAASGRPCINLDPWAMGTDACAALLDQHATDSDVVIIEGVMGLFDGPEDVDGSTASLAKALGLPVMLVIDASHQSQSVAALAKGFATFMPGLDVAGVFLNRVKSERHSRLLMSALFKSGMPVLGQLRHSDSHHLPSRHLGLIQALENQQLEDFLETAAAGVSRETILDNLIQIGSEITNQAFEPSALLPPLGQTIAVARDEAFAFSYAHMLEGWRKMGAELKPFSPLADESPDASADAVFLPGGYPELNAGRLSANRAFLAGLRQFPGIIYGECGGFMVMGDALVDAEGRSHAMAGLLPVTTSFASRKLHLGYRQLRSRNPALPTLLRGHEFHYSSIASQGDAEPLFDAATAAGQALPPMGMTRGRIMGSYAHIIAMDPTGPAP